jgi:hypothetical protein
MLDAWNAKIAWHERHGVDCPYNRVGRAELREYEL